MLREFTDKTLYKQYLEVAWPAVMEMVLVSLISSVDTMMVGRLGRVAIAAVGLTQQPRLFMLTLIMALNIGVMTAVGRLKGAGDQTAANQCLKSVVLFSTVISLVSMVLSLVFAEQIIWFAGANDETREPAVLYFRYIAVGNLFYSVGLTVTAAQRGIGNTKISMRTNLAANMINVVLNYGLIGGHLGMPALGVEGAAIATMISNLAAMLIAFASVSMRGGYLNIFSRTGLAGVEVVRVVYDISRGALMERIGHRVGLLLFFKIVASIGTVEFAAYNICQRFTNLSYSIGDGLGVAAAALVAQSMGAEDSERARKFGRAGLHVAIICAAVYSISIFTGQNLWISLFTNDKEVTSLCKIGLSAISMIVLVHVPQTLLMGTLRGAGDTDYLAKAVLLSTMIYRPVMGVILCTFGGYGLYGVYLSAGSETLLRFCLTIQRFLSAKWQEKK